jgi:hypothetical protein
MGTATTGWRRSQAKAICARLPRRSAATAAMGEDVKLVVNYSTVAPKITVVGFSRFDPLRLGLITIGGTGLPLVIS